MIPLGITQWEQWTFLIKTKSLKMLQFYPFPTDIISGVSDYITHLMTFDLMLGIISAGVPNSKSPRTPKGILCLGSHHRHVVRV